MPGKPFQSKLKPYETELREILASGVGYRGAALKINRRMARLIANLPVLAAGFPPILVPMSRRSDYIDLIWRYQNAVGRIDRGSRLLPPHPALREFESLLLEEWQKSTSLVEEARQLARQRRAEAS